MAWELYQEWQRHDRQNRPDVSLADGYIAGAVVSLQVRPDDAWIAEILGNADLSKADDESGRDKLSGPRLELLNRLTETRSLLTAALDGYVPTLEVDDDGEFDLSGWASGFLEATAPDLDIWLYHLAGRPESGLLGAIATHAVGPLGDAARARIARHKDRHNLEVLHARSWEFIPFLMQTLYERKVELADLGA